MLKWLKILFTDYRLSQSDAASLEKSFLLPLILLTGVLFLMSAIGNYFLSLDNNMVVIPMVGTLVFICLYFFARRTQSINIIRWVFIVLILMFINLVWYYNYASEGPWIYLFVLLFSYLIFMLSGWQLFWTVVLIVLNVAVLFAYDYYFYETISSYPTILDQITDSYLSVLIFIIVVFLLMSLVKRSYLEEYRKAVLSDQLKSSFLTNMSHEIRTPLNAIVGFSNLLAEGNLSADDKESFRKIINDGNNDLMRLIDDILDVSLIESGQISLNIEPCDVNLLMAKIEKRYLPILKERNPDKFKLVSVIPDERVIINVDCGRLQQIVVNLLDNALKFTEKGEVSYGFTVRKDSLSFFVKDTGIGIEDKHLDHLFDRFYKVEDDTSKLYRGTGIGLFLVKNLVEYLGGTIEVQSVRGQGTQFSFDIPAVDMVIERSEKSPMPAVAEKKTLKNSTFLVIEDDKMSSIFLDRMLSNEKVTVYRASDGEKGLKIFKEHPEINLVLLDIKLPGMDGFAVLNALKKINNKVPVIAQTAMAMIGDRKKCMDAGFDEYITKPLNANLLMKKIQMFVLPDLTDDNS